MRDHLRAHVHYTKSRTVRNGWNASGQRLVSGIRHALFDLTLQLSLRLV